MILFFQFFIVGEQKIGCHKLILSMSCNNCLLDASMDTIILPDFSPSTVTSFVKYFYSGETFISDPKSLNEFLALCEIFKFNVNGMEVTDIKLTEDTMAVDDENFVVNQSDDLLNEDALQEEEIFESVDDMVEIGDNENQHVEQLEELENIVETTGDSDDLTLTHHDDEFNANSSSGEGNFNSSFISMTSDDNLQGTLKDIKSRRLNLIQNEYDSHSSQPHISSLLEQSSIDDSSNSSVPPKRSKTNR